LERGPQVFQLPDSGGDSEIAKEVQMLYEQIGKLSVENEFLKKNLVTSESDRRPLIDFEHASLSIREQCRILKVNRGSLYYEPKTESAENLSLMQELDKLNLEFPFAGSRMLRDMLYQEGRIYNRKRIQRLMRLMAIEAVYPKKSLSGGNPAHKKYPYLLRNMEIAHPNHVWGADITYVPMACGFLYLFAIIDWFSRFVLSWELSNSLSNEFCILALERAVKTHGKPSIFNTDQGVQFTSNNFISAVIDKGILLSMDGKGRAIDNVFTERLWRSVKYEEIYLKDYESGKDAYLNLREYFKFYNTKRPHSKLARKVLSSVYFA